MPVIVTWMQLEITIPSQKKMTNIICITYMWNLKYGTQMNVPVKWKQTPKTQNQTRGCQRGGRVGRVGSMGLADAN